MKKVLITGNAGLSGKACASLFVEKGWEVIGIDNNSRAHYFGTEKQESKNGITYNVDIRSFVEVEEIFQEHTFDVIVHCASQPSHDYATDHAIEDFDVNARATLILLEMTRKYSPKATFVFLSTDKVYGENMSAERLNLYPTKYSVKFEETETRYQIKNTTGIEFPGFKEDLELDFAGDRSLFGCSKAAADMYVQEYGAKFGMKTACLRLGCITGKDHQGAPQHGFLAYLAKCIKEGIEYKVHGNGKQVRDQIHAKDLARIIYEIVQNPTIGAVYNIGGGSERAVSLLEAVALIEKETGKKAKLSFGEPNRKGDRLYDVHDVTKFRSAYPQWDYTMSLNDIIKDICS